VSHRTLYLQLNKQFASRAALLSLREPELHLDHALFPFVASLGALAHFASACLGYLAGKVLDHFAEESIGKTETAVKQYAGKMRDRFRSEQAHPSTDPKESDKLVAEADTALDPYFELLPSVNPPVLESALTAAFDATKEYLRGLGIPEEDAAFLSRAVENEIRAAVKGRLPKRS
jgi:hypothetical protein